jgi:hypothetical protein
MQENVMHVVAVRGTWSETGNFSAYPLGVPNGGDGRVHIPANVMKSAGFEKDDVVPFPLQILASKTTHTQRMKDGKLTEVDPWERLTASFVGKNEVAIARVRYASEASVKLTDALVEEALKDVKVTSDYLKEMQAAI